jgi:hypothetical protein
MMHALYVRENYMFYSKGKKFIYFVNLLKMHMIIIYCESIYQFNRLN